MNDPAGTTFFSYSGDAEFVLRLAKDMRAAGAGVWLDQLDIGPGEHWDRAVEAALHECSRLMVVLSPASVKSENVMDEVSLALEKHKQIIPVLLRDCQIPFRLHRMIYIDFRTDYNRGLRELLSVVATVDTVPSASSRTKISRFAVLIIVIMAAIAGWLYIKHCPSSPNIPQSHFVTSGRQSFMPQKHKKIIIFVHGVIGDMDNTWVNPINHASWPELVAGDKDFDGYDVYVYGYDTPCEGSSSNISEIANRFGQQLRDDHFFSNYEQIFFITHSMGGLVTKKMLAGLSMAQEIDSLQRVRAVIFIAVPSDGADIASLGSWFSRNPQFKNMDPEGTKAFLQTIEGDWGTVIRKRTEQRPFPRSFEAYETKDLGVFRIVPNLFISGISDLTPIAFDYDHIAIVKPDSREHAVYKWTKARILESSQYGMESVIARENLVAGIGSTRIPKKVFVIEVLDGTSLIANAKVSVKLEGFEKAFDGRTDARGRFQFMWSPQSKPVRAHYIVKAKGFMELNDEYPLLDNPVYRVPLNRER